MKQNSVFMESTQEKFYVIIEQDEEGNYIGEIPELCACYSQGTTVDELMTNIQEVVELCLEERGDKHLLELISIEKVLSNDKTTHSNR